MPVARSLSTRTPPFFLARASLRPFLPPFFDALFAGSPEDPSAPFFGDSTFASSRASDLASGLASDLALAAGAAPAGPSAPLAML